jgi:hypothetical protein
VASAAASQRQFGQAKILAVSSRRRDRVHAHATVAVEARDADQGRCGAEFAIFPEGRVQDFANQSSVRVVRQIDHQADDVCEIHICGFERGVKIFHGLPRLIVGAFAGNSAVRTPGVLSDEGEFSGYDTRPEESGLLIESIVMYNACHPTLLENLLAGVEMRNNQCI